VAYGGVVLPEVWVSGWLSRE